MIACFLELKEGRTSRVSEKPGISVTKSREFPEFLTGNQTDYFWDERWCWHSARIALELIRNPNELYQNWISDMISNWAKKKARKSGDFSPYVSMEKWRPFFRLFFQSRIYGKLPQCCSHFILYFLHFGLLPFHCNKWCVFSRGSFIDCNVLKEKEQ